MPGTVNRFKTWEAELFRKSGIETLGFWTTADNSAFVYLWGTRTAQQPTAIGRLSLRVSALAETIRPRKLAMTAMQQKLVTPAHSVKDAAELAAASSGVGSSRPTTRRGSKTRLLLSSSSVV